MASGKLQDTWYIWVLALVAVVFAFLAFSKDRPGTGAGSDAQTPPAVQGARSESPVIDQVPLSATPDEASVPARPGTGVVEPLKNITPKDSFAVQVYSFKEKARAEASLKILKDKNYPAYIMVSDLGERGIWYRVRIGSFTTEAQAQDVLSNITRDFKSGIIVTE
jgi:cell division septation protein DedD